MTAPVVLPSIRVALAVALAATALGTSCGGGDDDPGTPDAGPDPRCLEAENHSDLAWLQENIFTRSCAAFSACHRGRALSAGGLNLEDGNTLENVVDVPSDLADGMVLVSPGSPADSYMMVILGQFGNDDPRIDPEVGTMPYNNMTLCQEKRDAIARWISEM